MSTTHKDIIAITTAALIKSGLNTDDFETELNRQFDLVKDSTYTLGLSLLQLIAGAAFKTKQCLKNEPEEEIAKASIRLIVATNLDHVMYGSEFVN